MKPRRRILRSPGRAKRLRWRAALHEAGHAIAFARVARVRATARVHADGSGHCAHGPVRDAFAEAIATAAGPIAEGGNWADSVPSWRPRRSAARPRKLNSVPPDVVHLSLLHREAELERAIGANEQSVMSAVDVEIAAELFLQQHGGEVLALAKQLFRDGSGGVRPW